MVNHDPMVVLQSHQIIKIHPHLDQEYQKKKNCIFRATSSRTKAFIHWRQWVSISSYKYLSLAWKCWLLAAVTAKTTAYSKLLYSVCLILVIKPIHSQMHLKSSTSSVIHVIASLLFFLCDCSAYQTVPPQLFLWNHSMQLAGFFFYYRRYFRCDLCQKVVWCFITTSGENAIFWIS